MRLPQAETNKVEREKQSEQRKYQLKRDEHLCREVEQHKWLQIEYCENQLRNLSDLVHEMATMVKVTPYQVTVPGIQDPNTLGRQGAPDLPQFQDIVETSEFQTQKKRSESSSSEVSTKG